MENSERRFLDRQGIHYQIRRCSSCVSAALIVVVTCVR